MIHMFCRSNVLLKRHIFKEDGKDKCKSKKQLQEKCNNGWPLKQRGINNHLKRKEIKTPQKQSSKYIFHVFLEARVQYEQVILATPFQ